MCGGYLFVVENCVLGIIRGFREGFCVVYFIFNKISEIISIYFSEDKLRISSFLK